jgi:hypothetical protein
MKSTLRYWLALLFLGAVVCACTLLLVQPDAPSAPKRSFFRSDLAPLFREGGYTNAQVAAAFERAIAGCHMVSTDQTREAADDMLLGLSAEYRLRPMSVLERMRCDGASEGVEGFRRDRFEINTASWNSGCPYRIRSP